MQCQTLHHLVPPLNDRRFYTGTNICRKSTISWMAKAELPLEITLDVSRLRIPPSARSNRGLAFAVWLAVTWSTAGNTRRRTVSTAHYHWDGGCCGTGYSFMQAPNALSHGTLDSTCTFACWVVRMQLPARLTWPKRPRGEVISLSCSFY